ncbi:hypothetical protein [Polyangium mundeleinium]|uniref:Lipoprotein n=1 Tax=Polyangium mundeleinium TaxID=2995306 RepID=A0ABT5EQU4_9BACT|nr:hypothetical protein [Polyangium mundeleinium]MDC0743714.1 hypothetical protein [Polyangium mundeleinium]
MRLSMIVPVALLGLFAVGCGGSDTPDPNDPSQQNQYANGQQPGAYNPNQYQQPAPTAVTPTPAPTTVTPAPTTGASGGSPATPIAPAAAQVATLALQGLAASEAPGMQADGAPFAAQFQEGQVLEQAINIEAGKCYSVIASGVGVQQLDVQLVLHAAPLPPQVLAQSNGQGATAILGGKANGCFKNPLPIGGPGKVIVKATRGAGLAAAQIYKK